jgi:hypothetical protein
LLVSNDDAKIPHDYRNAHLQNQTWPASGISKVLESKALPEHKKIGMKILGPFLSVEDNNTFFWMRAFPDLKSRARMRDEFYEGKLWKEELEHKLMPMLEKYDVVVVEAAGDLGSWQ